MNQPTVSILIPTFNRENFITETVQSALVQTYKDFEIVIVDNQSTDKTYEVCLDLAKTDQRIRVYQNEENIGPVRNWQRCVELAKGRYSKILFSDDLIHPKFLEKTLPFLKNSSVGFVFTSILRGQKLKKWVNKDSFNLLKQDTGVYNSKACIKAFLFGIANTGTPTSALFRTEDLKKNLLLSIPSPSINTFPNHGAGVDIIPMLLTANNYPDIAYVNEPLAFFRGHDGSISSRNRMRLQTYYHQANIWFADNYIDKSFRKKIFLLIWLEAMKNQRKWLNPFSYIQNFTSTSWNLRLSDIMIITSYVIRTLLKKIFTSYKKWRSSY